MTCPYCRGFGYSYHERRIPERLTSCIACRGTGNNQLDLPLTGGRDIHASRTREQAPERPKLQPEQQQEPRL